MTDQATTADDSDNAASRPGTEAERADLPVTLVAIGASAGGLESLERFFRAMPADSGMAFVVIQHLSPDFKSMMDELLERFTRMPVVMVDEQVELCRDHVYLLPPRKEIKVVGNTLVSRQREKESGLFLPINVFLRSLAAAWGERSVGIILSGTGSDGTNGLFDVRDAGGIIIAESPDTARFSGMPQSVINTLGPDAILAPENMPEFLMNYAGPGKQELAEQHAALRSGPRPVGVPAILELLRNAYKIDFSQYKPGTIQRRIELRLALNATDGTTTLADYASELASDRHALSLLYRDLLIGVTRFFRDVEAFGALRLAVIPQVLSQVPEGSEVRVWDCGCSTGEEAYSIAILFLEAFRAAGRTPQIKILATDLHDESLQAAAQGVYPEESLVDLPTGLRERYFEPLGDNRFKVLPHLRKTVVFSRHNVLSDPPFTRMDLVSCRNLLIYLKPEAQARALAAMHYALRLEGMLFLGASESISNDMDEFEAVDRHWKFFRKVRDARLIAPLTTAVADYQKLGMAGPRGTSMSMLPIMDAMLQVLVPNGLLISEDLDLLHIFGDARRYLEPRAGRFSGNIASLICKDLHVPLVSAIRNCGKKGHRVVIPGVRIALADGDVKVQMTVQPVSARSGTPVYYIATLQEEAIETPIAREKIDAARLNVEEGIQDYIRELEHELQRTRESLQATVEELETSNEELQASNEELLASNEELQSTDEELHSVNEELLSVNTEHELKINELNQVSSDIRNLIQSTDTATIFVDLNLAIRLYTPRARDIFSLLQQDVGRDLRHFKPSVPDEHLILDLERVLVDEIPVGRYVACGDGHSYLRRCSPYRDITGRLCGVVINYTDTSEISAASAALEESELRLEAVLETSPTPVLVLDSAYLVVSANPASGRLFGQSADALIGRSLSHLLDVGGDSPRPLAELLDASAEQGEVIEGVLRALQPDGRRVPVEMMASRMQDSSDQYHVVALIDTTRREQAEQAQQKALDTAENLALARTYFMANMSHELRTPLNGVLGFTEVALSPRNLNNREKVEQCLKNIRKSGEQLLQVINDVLDFSKIDVNAVAFIDEPVDLRALVEGLLAEQQAAMAEKNLSGQFDCEGLPADGLMRVDRLRLRQILVNLLGNAVKFTEQGGIVVQVARDGDELRIDVRDTGCGIADGDLERVFRPFEQADSSTSRRYGGTGLGLAISQRLAALMGGRLTIDSVLGQGSCVSLCLPWRPASGPASPASAVDAPS